MFTTGDDMTVPSLNQVLWAAAGVGSGGSEFARLISPSLRRLGNRYIAPINGGNDGDVEPNSPPNVVDFSANPLQLVTTESSMPRLTLILVRPLSSGWLEP